MNTKEKFFKWCEVTTKVNDKNTIVQFPIDLNHLDKHVLPKLKKEWDLIELIWDVGAWDIHLEKYTSPSKHFYLGKEVGKTFEDLVKAIYKTIEKLYL